MKISKEAFDLIVREEVSSEEVYKRKYTHPEWPGVQSGVTIGIGYDVGYSTRDKLRRDWKGAIGSETISALEVACGITGVEAKELTKRLQSVVVPWEAAIKVFRNVSIPEWEAKVAKAIPGSDELPPDCFGVLVSLSYNRGLSYNNAGDRYSEMRAIKKAIVEGRPEDVPALLVRMARIWPTVPGLQKRRKTEAALFKRGLEAAEKPVEEIKEPTPTEDTPGLAEEAKSFWEKWKWLKDVKDWCNWAALLRQGSIIALGSLAFIKEHKEIFIAAAVLVAAYAVYKAIKR